MEERKSNRNNGFYKGLLVGVFASAIVICVCAIGFKIPAIVKGVQNNSGSVQEQANHSKVNEATLEKLELIESVIEKYYYKDDYDLEAIEEGAYRGMMRAIEDPYSTYYSAEELTALMEQTEGIYYGIGAYVGLDTTTSLPKIIGTITGTPAEAADLRPDDIIYEVDGVSTYDMDLSEVVGMIKGDEGTKVMLTIVRSTQKEQLYVEVERRRVESPTVNYEMLENDIAYIQIIEFDSVTVDQFADALATAQGAGMKGLVLDLRSNPGGSLTAVVDIARMILPQGKIVYTENKQGTRQEFTCDGKNKLETPLVVLIDGNSASAAEILAGSIQDYQIGTLVGTTTFGKGIVQQIVNLSDGSAVKITVSSYFTPNGRNIHGIGIEPDEECVFDADAYYNQDYDNQLERAKEVLLEKMN